MVFSDDEHAWGPSGTPNSLGCTFHRVLEWMGRLWGGKHMSAVPVVDGAIPRVFVTLARAYDPDLVLEWQLNLAEIEQRDPAWGSRIEATYAKVPDAAVPAAEQRRSDTRVVGRESEHAAAFAEAFKGLVKVLSPFGDDGAIGAHHLQTQIPRPLTDLFSLTPWTLDLPPSPYAFAVQHPLSGAVTDFDLSGADPWVATLLKMKLGVTGAPEQAQEPRPPRERATYRSFDPAAPGLASMVARNAFLDVELSAPRVRGVEVPEDPSGTSWWGSSALASTPMRRSGYGLESYQYVGLHHNPALLIILGDTTADAALYLMWTRVFGDGTAAWIPSSVLDDLEIDQSQEILETVRDMVHARRMVHLVEGWFASFTSSKDQLRRLQQELGAQYWDKEVLQAIQRFRIVAHPDDIDVERAPDVFTVTPQTFGTTRAVAFRDDVAQTPLLSPVPPIMHEGNAASTTPLHGNWVADVVIGDCKLPRHPYAANAAEATPILTGNGELRCGRTGTSWIAVGTDPAPHGLNVEHVLNPFLARTPRMSTVLDVMLEPPWTWQPSSAGRYYEGFTRLSGGFQGLLSLMKDSYTWPLLQAFVDGSSHPGFVVDAGKVMTLEHMFEVLRIADGSPATFILEDAATARRLTLERVDDLVSRRILAPGHVLSCARCSHTAFYPLEDVGRTFICKRCSDAQTITTLTWRPKADAERASSPGWFYRLDGLVEQALKQRIEGPALALERLGVSGERPVYSWAVTLRRPAAPSASSVDDRADALGSPATIEVRGAEKSVEVEVDFVALVDGRLIVGEAKTNDHLGDSTAASIRKEIQKTGRAAHALNADRVVFATTKAAWNVKTTKALDSFASTSAREVVSLQNIGQAVAY